MQPGKLTATRGSYSTKLALCFALFNSRGKCTVPWIRSEAGAGTHLKVPRNYLFEQAARQFPQLDSNALPNPERNIGEGRNSRRQRAGGLPPPGSCLSNEQGAVDSLPRTLLRVRRRGKERRRKRGKFSFAYGASRTHKHPPSLRNKLLVQARLLGWCWLWRSYPFACLLKKRSSGQPKASWMAVSHGPARVVRHATIEPFACFR